MSMLTLVSVDEILLPRFYEACYLMKTCASCCLLQFMQPRLTKNKNTIVVIFIESVILDLEIIKDE